MHIYKFMNIPGDPCPLILIPAQTHTYTDISSSSFTSEIHLLFIHLCVSDIFN